MSLAQVTEIVVLPYRASKLQKGWTIRHRGLRDRITSVKRRSEKSGGLIEVHLETGAPIRCVDEYEVDVEVRRTRPAVAGETGASR